MTTHRLGLARRLQSFDAIIALVGTVALCMLGPLRGFSEAHALLAFVSTLALFMVPGILLSHWFLGEYFPGAALLPVAFVLSVSLFGVLAVPVLILHAGLGAYLWITAMVVFAFLGAATLRTFLERSPAASEGKESEHNLLTHLSVGVLWIPFAALSAGLEAVMNSIRNSLGMRETEIAREPSRLWNPHFYAVSPKFITRSRGLGGSLHVLIPLREDGG